MPIIAFSKQIPAVHRVVANEPVEVQAAGFLDGIAVEPTAC